MNHDEYMQGEPEDEDEILGEYLIEEVDDDISFIIMPKVKYDFEEEFEQYYKILKNCKSKDEIKQGLRSIIGHTSAIAVSEHEINYLQDRAKDFEFNIRMMQLKVQRYQEGDG